MTRSISNLLINMARLQAGIEREQRRPRPNWIAVLRMKLLRLRLKERMQAAIMGAARHRGRGGHATAASA